MEKDSALRTLVKGAGIAVIGIMVTNITGYLYKIVIGRMLGPEGYGIISQGLMIFSITATIAMFGLPSGVKRFVSKYKAEEKEKLEKGTVRSSLEIGLTSSIAAAIILFLGAKWFSIQFFGDPDIAIVIKILAFAVPMRALMSVSLSTSIAYKKLEYKIYARNITEGVVKIVSTLVLLALGFEIFGAALAVLLGWISAASLAFYLMHTRIRPYFTDGKPFSRPYRKLVKFSGPLIFSNVFGQITSWADIFLVGFFMSSASVGIYNSALPTAMILGMASSAITALSVPVMTEMYAKEKLGELEKVYKTGTKWVFMLAFPGALLMALFADQGLSLMFGREFVEQNAGIPFIQISTAGLSLALLTLGYLLFSVTSLSRQLVQATGDTQYNLYISGIVGAGNLGLNLLLIPMFGIVGAALATASSWVLGGFFSLYYVYRDLKIHPFKSTFLPVVVASIISAFIPYAVSKALFETVPRLIIFPAFLAFVALYVTLFLVLGGLEKDDSMILKSIENKLGVEVPYLDRLLERYS
ncbi:MAG: flippase [Candidatus Nanohaloarchaea archaeon]